MTSQLTSLCVNLIVSSYFLWASSQVQLFHFLTFDIFLTFWHMTYYLNYLSSSQSYILTFWLMTSYLNHLSLMKFYFCFVLFFSNWENRRSTTKIVLHSMVFSSDLQKHDMLQIVDLLHKMINLKQWKLNSLEPGRYYSSPALKTPHDGFSGTG